MSKKKTLEDVLSKIKEYNENIKILSDSYEGMSSRVECLCLVDGNRWSATWSSLYHNKTGCAKCSNVKRINFSDFKKELSEISPNISVLSESYQNAHSKLLVRCEVDGYEWEAVSRNLLKGSKCPMCSNRVPYTLETVIAELNKINKNIKILSGEYKNNTSKLKCMCLIDGYVWDASWCKLRIGRGCPACSNQVVTSKNSIHSNRPDLLKYLKNIDDGLKFSTGTPKKISLVCIDCGTEQKVSSVTLCKFGFTCKLCGDGISKPQKFCAGILSQLGVEFECEFSPKWGDRKRYDFYFNNMICECHGAQHYETIWKKLEDEVKNDTIKRKLAMENGISDYITVNCKDTSFDGLKSQFTNQFSKFFDLKDINWEIIWDSCQKSIIKKVCDLYNVTESPKKVEKISEYFHVGKTTTRNYLKVGSELGWTSYPERKVRNNV